MSFSSKACIASLALAWGFVSPWNDAARAQVPPPTSPKLLRGFYFPTGANPLIFNSTGSFVILAWNEASVESDSVYMGFRVRRTIEGISQQPWEVVGQYKRKDQVTRLCVARLFPCAISEFAFMGSGVFFKGFQENEIRDGAGLPTGSYILDYPPGAPQDACDSCFVFVDIATLSGIKTQYAVTAIDTLRLTNSDFTESAIDPSEIVTITPATPPAGNLERVAVVPNPFRLRAEWDPPGGGHRVHFIHLPDRTKIRIYTTSLELIRTLEHDAGSSPGGRTGELEWDLKNEEGRAVVSGIYVYQAETPAGLTRKGHFVIIK